ncbi:MAG TPA: NDP-sugar synthase, partial [Mycobacteriales bacterium]|nr:NDP-sugar synthase [Mycobacteriales bacterium]
MVLVGGQGTRLRPLTLTAPKPMLPTAGVPFLTHLLSRIGAIGVRHVVLSTSYRPEVFADHFGTGEALGLELEYVTEEVPLGTGGGIRNVADRLRSHDVLVFNGDVLSGVDLQKLVATHRDGRADVTLHLTRVEDPRAFGSVPTDAAGRVQAFLEKSPEPVTDQVNAGCYVFRRPVLESIPAGRPVSVERETFPGLLAAGAAVLGYVDSTYWLDLGTPATFVRGCADLVLGIAPTAALPGRPGQSLVLPGATVAADAALTGGSTVGAGCTVGAGARLDAAVLFDGAMVADGASVTRSVVGRGAVVGPGTVLADAVVGDGAELGAGNELLG